MGNQQATVFKRRSRSLRRTNQVFCDLVQRVPRKNPFPSDIQESAALISAAWDFAAAAARSRTYKNPIDCAHDMAQSLVHFPRPAITRMDLERIALDAWHLARRRKGGKA